MGIRAFGVDDCQSPGQGLLAFMVIGHNDIDPLGHAVGDFLCRGDAVIHRDDEIHALFHQGFHRRQIHAVALLQAVGDPENSTDAHGLEIFHQHGHRRSAVHIVVPVNTDQLFPVPGRHQPLDGGFHVRQPEGIVKILGRGVQIGHGRFTVLTAPFYRHTGDGVGNAAILRNLHGLALQSIVQHGGPFLPYCLHFLLLSYPQPSARDPIQDKTDQRRTSLTGSDF